MNRDDQFENRLRNQPLREVPSAWRGEILTRARDTRHESQITRHASRITLLFSTLRQQLSTCLWPHPRAWAGLAAVWMVIFAVNVASRDGSATNTMGHVPPPSPQIREMLKQQEQLLTELVGEAPAAGRPKAVLPRPHSFYRNEFLSA